MTIPTRNLYWLLCYAWDVLDEADLIDVGRIESPDVHDLLASLLVAGIRKVARRGLDRDYVETREDTSALRGRIDLTETSTRLLERHARAHVVYDELSSDIPANQVLKATVRVLLQDGNLTRESREELAGTYRSLRWISDQRLSPTLFRQVRIHRNNRSYRLLMEVCRLVLDHLVADRAGGNVRFRGFLEDERALRTLFQKFVFNFYSREQRTYSVRSDAIPWQNAEVLLAGPGGLPTLRTDITLRCKGRLLIIDTKFTGKAFEAFYGEPKLRTAHLYQLWAYVSNFAERERGRSEVEGMLLYPAVDDAFRAEWTIQGHRLSVAAIDLRSDWSAIRRNLLELVGFTA